jgi:tetratricopeptide (TPR) repeat protein
MAESLNKVIILYRDHSVKPLGPVDYQRIVDRYNYIGWVRKKQGKLSEAWANHEQALRILHEHLPPTHPRLALTYNHTASLHLMVNNHLSALDCLEKALHIQEKALKPNHPHLAETHFQLSVVFEHLNKIDEAFQHAKKAIDIGRQAFLTPNDPHIKQYQEQFDKILLLSQSCNELVL